MSSSNSIKYFYIGNLTTKKTILEDNILGTSQNEKDAYQIFERLSSLKEHKFEERTKISNRNGKYYFVSHRPNRFYIIVVDNSFNESYAFELINEVDKSSVIKNIDNNDNTQVSNEGKTFIRSIIEKYEKKKTNISEISNDVNDIKLEMKENIKTILNSNEKAEDLKKQSESIKEGGDLFSKNANEARKITCWKNWKLTIIIILIIIGVLLAIIVPIVATKSESETIVNEVKKEKDESSQEKTIRMFLI